MAKKYLLNCKTSTIHDLGISPSDVVENMPGLRYWCYAEHVTPSGREITYIFLCFYSDMSFEIMQEYIGRPFFWFHTDYYKDSKPSRLIRNYIKTNGFSFYLGKSKPIPGTFIEKKGGL